VSRFDQDGSAIVAVGMAKNMVEVTIGTRLELDESMASTTVYRTGHAARVDWPDWSACPPGSIAEVTRRLRTVSSVCSPIFVEGRLWGVVTVGGREHLPLRSEERLEKFAQLVGTAIANADSRAELIASRARLVTASDEARRRFERDLHDGVQQRLVSLALDLSDAEAIASRENEELIAQLSRAGERLDEAMDELRKLSRGIHPTIVSTRGLARALKALAQRSAVPVELNLSIDEAIPEHVKVGAYYVVSEALTNAAKHAHASKVDLVARMADGILRLTISDNGVGGANPALGSGLTGLQDRVAALGGTIVITSPLSHGTSLRVALQVG
jgi:signal transduction histidine kinase